jgi:hypothetical protein
MSWDNCLLEWFVYVARVHATRQRSCFKESLIVHAIMFIHQIR